MSSAIIVDSTATLSEELENHPDIYQVYLSVVFPDGQVFHDSSDEEVSRQFYTLLSESDELPTTSQPEPAMYVDLFNQLIDEGYDQAIMISLASEISGTFQTASLAAQSFEDKIKIKVIDSKGTSFLMENMVIQTLEMIDRGMDLDQMEEALNWVADHSVIYAAVEDLNYIVKGGRIRGSTAALGSLLNIKPVIYFNEDGAVDVYGKVRTSKRIGKLYKNLVQEALEERDHQFDIAFAHGNCEEEMLAIQDLVKQVAPDHRYRLGFLTAILGVHGGEGCKGMGIIAQADLDKFS